MVAARQEASALVADLQSAIGRDNVKFDTTTRVLYSTDASNYQIMPIGVTFPRDSDDVCAIHELAGRYGVPVLPRGGGSSLAGQAVGTAVVMDFTRHMRRITSINAEEKVLQVQPGLTLGLLNTQIETMGLIFGPDPASAERATVGGVIGNNSAGAHSIIYGMTADHVRRLEVVLTNGEKVWLDSSTESLNTIREKVAAIVRRNIEEIAERYPKTFRTCAGYALDKIDPDDVNLKWLLAGSEGTLATTVNAELDLVTLAPIDQKRLAIVHFDNMRASLEATPRILELKPMAIELMDKFLMDKTRAHPEYSRSMDFIEGDPAVVLIVEFEGENDAHLLKQIEGLRALLKGMGHTGSITIATTAEEQARVWKVRKVGLGLMLSQRGDAKPIAFVEDAAVPVEHLADYISEVEDIIYREDATYAVYAHASAGCLHVRPLVNLKSLKGRQQYRNISDGVTEVVLKYRGTITGEHGAGLARGEQEQVLFGKQLVGAFAEVKQAFDPTTMMNPGKIVNPPKMDDEAILRYTPSYKVDLPSNIRLNWSSDFGFDGAVEMCNGAGVCRKEGTGTMCPSYQATLDEAHSTRGRANALRAAISGRLPGGLGSKSLYEVYELCLSCKACKAECPSAVDVAAIKAEFLAQYHDIHGTPLASRVFGNIHRINRLAGLFPALSNWMMSSALGKWGMKVLGIPTQRPLPRYARRRFMKTVTDSAPNDGVATLIVDTFADYNHPEIPQAFVEIVEKLGLPVRIRTMPAGTTGRPAISKGLIDSAKRIAIQNIQALNPDEGPFLFIEPSELSAVVDDYLTLVPPDMQEGAMALAAVSLPLEAWLAGQIAEADLAWDGQPRNIMLHGHCHQKALWSTDSTLKLLRAIPNTTVSEIPSGCCGVAGSFGYEHYDISMKIANDRLLPAIESAPPGTLFAAPGTSCRAQISDAGHRVYHPVEIVRQALRG